MPQTLMKKNLFSASSPLLLAAIGLSSLSAQAQNASGAQDAGGPAAAPTASSLLTPALSQLRQSLSGVRLDKWKAPGPVREETNDNMSSITRDLDGTLPGLLTTADAAPGVISKNLPVFRNVDALYDVLLRVVETADLSAPERDSDTLHQALTALDNARRAMGDAMEAAAVNQEQQVITLRGQLKAQMAAAAAHPVASTVVTDETRHTAVVHKRKPKPQPPAETQTPQ